MSKTIDEKVVEMRFDNKHFETNVKTTLSTLDKLKAKLNLTGASKGLEEVNKASKKVDFSHMENSLAALEKRFSTTGIVGMTVIQNLTNAGLRFAKTLSNFSIGGILEGGKARATKIENAKFQIKGLLKDMDNADQKLKDIMSDVNYGVESTAYGLDAAATVAAQLVASGMEAGEGMRSALRGISGVAAMTNSTYEDIGRIYTKVAGNGRLMGEELLQLSSRGMNAAAVLAKSLNKTEAEVRDMVSKGKISFEMFSKAMDDAFGEHAKDANNTLNGVLSNIRAALSKIGADFYGPLIAEKSPLVLFLNSVRERINEFRKTIAPITEEVTTRINNFITKIDNAFKNANVLGYNPLAKFSDKIQGIKDILKNAMEPVDNAVKVLNKASKAVKDYDTIVNEIISGKWKNQPVRQKLLEEAGYNFYHAQNMVNEKLGNSFRYADDYVEAMENSADSTETLVSKLEDLSEEQMRNMGFTEEQIQAFNELRKMAEKTGIPIKDLIELINTKDGKDDSAFNTRYLILNSLKNIGYTLISIFKSVGKAFSDVFAIKADGLFDIIAAFHKLTTVIKNKVEGNAESLTRTLRGLFSIIHIITSFISGTFKIVTKVVSKVLESFGISFLDVTAAIGDAIYNFDKWITSNESFINVGKSFIEIIVAIIKYIIDAIKMIKGWITENKTVIKVINDIRNAFGNLGDTFSTWIQGLKETDNVPKYIIDGLINGLKNGAGKVFEVMGSIANGIFQTICNILGIASPSKVMIAIGGFIIAGLVAGIQDGSINLMEVLSGLGNKIISMFKQIDLGKVLAIGLSAGTFLMINKIINVIDKLTAPLEGFSNLMTGLGNMFDEFGDSAIQFTKSLKYQGLASIIKSVAIMIGVLAAALWVLAQIPHDQLVQGGNALGLIIVVLTAFLGAVVVLANKMSGIKLPNMGAILAMMLGITLAMTGIAKALKIISKIDNMKQAILGLTVCVIALVALITIIGGIGQITGSTDAFDTIAKTLLNISASMLILAIALKVMSIVTNDDINKAITVIGSLVILLLAFTAINVISGGSLNQASDTIKSCAVAILLLAITARLCRTLNAKDFLNTAGVITLFLGLMTGLMIISKKFPETEMIKVSGSILLVAIAIGMLAIIAKMLSEMNFWALAQGVAAVAVLSALVAGLLVVSKMSGSINGMSLMGAAMCILAMGLIAFLLGQIDVDKLAIGIVAVGILTAFTAALIKATKGLDPGVNAAKTLSKLAIIIVLLSLSLVALSFIDWQKMVPAAASLGVVLFSLASVLKAIGNLKFKEGALKTFVFIATLLAILTGIMVLLANIPNMNNALTGATGIAVLAGTLTLMVIALAKLDGRHNVNKKFIIALYELIPLLIGIALVLVVVGNVENAINNALALSVLLIAMTGVLAVISVIGKYLGEGVLAGVLGLLGITVALIGVATILASMNSLQNALANATALSLLLSVMTICLVGIGLIGTNWVGILGGVVGLLAICGELLILVGVLKEMEGMQHAITNSLALSLLMTSISEALFKLAIVGPLALIADAAILGLIGVITTVGVLATIIGGIMEVFPDLKRFLDKGLPILEQIALSIGKILGNVVAGFMNSVAEELPHTAEKLSEFATKAMPFIVIMSTVTDNVMNGVGILAKSILALAGANFVDAIASWFSNGQSFSRLGTELSNFAINALPFIATMNIIKPEIMEGAKNLADAVLSFSKGNFWDAITSWITGGRNLAEFGKTIAPLGTGLKEFSSNLGEFSPEQVDTVDCACRAIKAIAEAAEEIPKHGGIAQAFTGDNDIGEFAGKFKSTGQAIREFVEELTKDGIFDEKKIEIVKSGCEALKCIAEVAGEIPKHGGIAQAFTGDNDIGEFAGKLGKVAEGLRGFVWELQKDNVITDKSIDKINAVNNIMWAISDLGKINVLDKDFSSKLEELSARLGSFANKITEYVKSMSTISDDDLKNVKEKCDRVIEISTALSNVNNEPIEKLGETLKNFAEDSVKKFIDGLKNNDLKDAAFRAMEELVDKIIEAMKSKEENINTSANNIMDIILKAFEFSDYITRATNAGYNLVIGFANGIKDKENKVYNAAYAIGARAIEAINKATDEHSPSKETFKSGLFFTKGFINGIESLSNNVYDKSYSIGDKARIGLSKAIMGVSNLIASGIDDEITIRPVLDLSDIKSGAASINSMFGAPSVGVTSNLNAISSGMRSYRQNGGENIVSAIERLRDNLGNSNGDTYNINGISYSDNAEISEAVQTLVRAARIERRS